MTGCPCGRPATHRVPVPRPSLRGMAWGWERRCQDHASQLAAQLLLDGLEALEVEALEELAPAPR